MNKRELKEVAAVQRFAALETRGGPAAVAKALAERRKKVGKKDRAWLPAPPK
jgi:hypothetical protein